MRSSFLFVIGLLISSIAFSQNRVGINEIQLTTNKGDQPGFEFFIPDTDADAVLSAWNKFHKSFKVKPKQDKNQRNYYFSDNAEISALSENTIDIFARIYETGGGVRFACAFDLGGVFISSGKTPQKFNQAKLILNKFYAQMAMDAIVAEIEKELAALETMKAEYETINQEIDAFEAKADQYQSSIDNNEMEQAVIEKDLDEKSGELLEQRSELQGKKSELAKINKAGIVADLTRFTDDLKKTSLQSTSIEKDIARKEATIESLQAEINVLNNDLAGKKEYEAELEQKIKDIEDLLVELNIDGKEDDVKLLEQNIYNIELAENKLKLKKANYKKYIEQDEAALSKIKKALNISSETRSLLESKIESQEAKLRELEELKATIE